MIAPASPPPVTPLPSAMDASPSDRLPPGKIAGARTSIAASRNFSSAASWSCRCPSVSPVARPPTLAPSA